MEGGLSIDGPGYSYIFVRTPQPTPCPPTHPRARCRSRAPPPGASCHTPPTPRCPRPARVEVDPVQFYSWGEPDGDAIYIIAGRRSNRHSVTPISPTWTCHVNLTSLAHASVEGRKEERIRRQSSTSGLYVSTWHGMALDQSIVSSPPFTRTRGAVGPELRQPRQQQSPHAD